MQISQEKMRSITLSVGFMYMKCIKKHPCNICEMKASVSDTNFLTFAKSYNNDTIGGLFSATDEFIDYIKELEKIFVNTFNKNY